MIILCKEPKKDIGIILKKQKFLFVIKKPNSASTRQCERAAVRARGSASARQCGFAGSCAGGHNGEQMLMIADGSKN